MQVPGEFLDQDVQVFLVDEHVQPGQGRTRSADHVHRCRSEGGVGEVDGQPAQVGGHLRECTVHGMGLYPNGVREKP